MSKPPFLELPESARAYRLPTARGEFAVLDAGEPREGTVLLVPGFTGSKEDFVALLGPLAREGFRVVAADGRGQYESGGPPDEDAYAQDALARDVHALTRALRAGDSQPADPRPADPRPVHLLGHSLGGLVSRAAVLRDAAPFASLTLMSSGPAAVAAGQQQRLKMLLGALPVMSMEQVWQAMRELDPVEAPEEETPREVARFLHARWLASVREQLSATARQLMVEPDRVEELARTALPVHVVSGEVDYAWPVPLLDEMARRLGASRTVVAGAGHSPNAERPAETARALARFWRESGEPGVSRGPGRTG